MSSTLGQTTIDDQHERLVDVNENAIPAQPYFLYRQDFENGDFYEGVSYGDSRFTQLSPSESSHSRPAFSVHKTFDPPSISVSIQSDSLTQTLQPFGFDLSRTDVLPIFEHFTNNTEFMDRTEQFTSEADSDWPQSTRELKLFFVDFLLDEAIFSDANSIRPGSVSPVVRQRMLRRKALLDLSGLEQACDNTEQGFNPIDKGSPGVLHETTPGERLEKRDSASYGVQSLSTGPQEDVLLVHGMESTRESDWSAFAKSMDVLDHAFGKTDIELFAIGSWCALVSTTHSCAYPHASWLLDDSPITCWGFSYSPRCAYHESKGRPYINCICDEFDPSNQATYGSSSSNKDAQERAQRWQIFSGFRKHFRKSLSTLEQHKASNMESNNMRNSSELSRFQLPRDLRSAWRGGIRVIRRLLQGIVPETVNQVILCVLVANALRIEDNTCSCTQEVFFQDLHRWRDVIGSNEDKHLFEEVVKVLLGKKLKKSPPFCRDDSLNRFQELFQNLLSEAGVGELEVDWHHGTRLSVIQACYTQGCGVSTDTKLVPRNSNHMDTAIHRSETYTGNWNPHDIGVIKLASTVVFCLVLALCLLLYHPLAHTKAMLLMQTIHCHGLEHCIDLIRNCILVACYLDFSQDTIENIFSKIDLHKDVKCRCSGCGKLHIRGNISRNERKCLKREDEAYSCQHCSKEIARKDNHARHEERCRNKLLTTPLNATGHRFELLNPALPPPLNDSTTEMFSPNKTALYNPHSNTIQAQFVPGISDLFNVTETSFDSPKISLTQGQGDSTPYSSKMTNITWSNLNVNAQTPVVPDTWDIYGTAELLPSFTDGVLANQYDNFAAYPPAMANSTWSNSYTSAQQQQAYSQFPIAPPQSGHEMDPWSEHRYQPFVSGAPALAKMGPALGLYQTYGSQAANEHDAMSYTGTVLKRKTPSSPTNDYFSPAKRVQSGLASDTGSVASFGSYEQDLRPLE